MLDTDCIHDKEARMIIAALFDSQLEAGVPEAA
jgi:hypothetical protein